MPNDESRAVNSDPASTVFFFRFNWYSAMYVVLIFLIIKYTLFYWTLIMIGGISSIGLVTFFTIYSKPTSIHQRRTTRSRKFRFLSSQYWDEEFEAQHRKSLEAEERTFEESFLISEVLNDFIDLIIKEFVRGWFSKVSSSEMLEDSIKVELKFAISELKLRLNRLDLAQLLVPKLIPVLHEHLKNFIKAETLAQQENSLSSLQPLEYNMAVARHYGRGKLHPGVSIITTSFTEEKERSHLRHKMGQLLPFILSSRERDNETAIALVREILSCTILSSILEMLSEGDFYNLLIVKLIGDNMKHRDQVKQLRAALEQHTQQLNHKLSSRALAQGTQQQHDTNDLIIDENMDSNAFKIAISNISKSNSLEQLEKAQKQNSYLVSKLEVDKVKASSYSKRLSIAKFVIQERISKLRKSKSEAFTEIDKISLEDILDNSFATNLFADFMSNRNRSDILALYQSIDLLKAPLEDSAMEHDGETELSLSLEFLDLDDVKKVYQRFLTKPNTRINQDVIDIVKDYVQNKDPTQTLSRYRQARKALFITQKDLFDTMFEEDFPEFKRSGQFTRLVQINSFSRENATLQSKSSTLFQLGSQIELHGENIGNDNDVSPAVVKAVEDALTQIMKNATGQHTDKSPQRTGSKSKNLHLFGKSDSSDTEFQGKEPSTVDLKKDLFKYSSSLFGDGPNAAEATTGKASKLFDDISDDSDDETDSLSTSSDGNMHNSIDLEPSPPSDSQVHLAAPGNLRLSEEIFKLDEEIDKLTEQQHILQPLLNKAELTNNIGELRILRKSNVSLDREIATKELQRQQYIVQENDNSLYGKSRVHVQSFISGNERGKEFILYIVEVQRFSSDEPDVIAAGWIVARRFSQFFKLHEYLKTRYKDVAKLKFPKRSVSVLKFQQKQLVELRKAALQQYLQSLINIPEVCSNKAFRSFLSSENFTLRKNEAFDETSNSAASSNNLKNNVEMVANKFYNSIQNRLSPSVRTSPISGEIDEEIKKNVREMERELRHFDETGGTTNESRPDFVKPICDLLICVFRLNSSKGWLRGRALLVILQQIFGTTIERKVTEQIDASTKNEEQLLDILGSLKQVVFPGGKFKDPAVLRTFSEKASSKREAKMLLSSFMTETCSKIFGLSNTQYASSVLFGVIQNDFLNKSLLFEILDVIFDELFPELASI